MSKVDVKAPDRYQGLGPSAAGSLAGGGAHGAIRTRDTRFRRAVLYPLSYVGGDVLKTWMEIARTSGLADFDLGFQ